MLIWREVLNKMGLYSHGAHLRPTDDRDVLATKIELEFNDMYHVKNLYKLAHEWLDDEYYESVDDLGECESLYWERNKPDGAKDNWISWRAMQIPHHNSYYRYIIRIDIQILGSKEVEVMHQGHKFKMNKANIKFVIEGWLQLDFKDQWRKHWLLKHFDGIFRRRWYKPHIDDFKWELYKDIYKLERQLKDYLQLKSPYVRPKLFTPEKGF